MKETAPVLPPPAPESGNSSLSKPSKQQRIAADVRHQIREGQVKPGDRLRPFTELTRLYSTSPGVVTEALDGLEKEGLILRKPRSGCYVTADAPSRLAAPPSVSAPSAAPPERSVDHAMQAYQSLPMRTDAPLTLATTDVLPAQLAAWDALLASYAEHSHGPAPSVRSLVPPFALTGPASLPHDLFVGTPTQLCAAGVESFLPVMNPADFGMPADAAIAPLRKCMEDSASLPGIPVAMAFPLLLLNGDLASAAGYTDFEDEGAPSALLQALAEAMPSSAAERPSFAADFGSLPRLMVHEGALLIEGEKGLTIDEERTRALLEAWADLREKFGPGPVATWTDYASGHVIVKSGFGFCGFAARTSLSFPWQSRFLPIAPDASGEALPILAAVRHDTPRLPECLDLVHYLCTPEAQRQIAARGDLVPAREDCLTPAALPLAPAINRKALSRWLGRLAASASFRPADNMLISDLERLGERFAASAMSVDQALAQFDVLVDRCRRLDELS